MLNISQLEADGSCQVHRYFTYGQLKDEGSAGPQRSLHFFDTHFATSEKLNVNTALKKLLLRWSERGRVSAGLLGDERCSVQI